MTSLNVRAAQVFGAVTWLTAGRCGRAILSAAVAGVLARACALETVGQYFLTLSVISTLGTLGQLGGGTTVVRAVSQALGVLDKQAANVVISVTTAWAAIGTTLTVACWIALSPLFALDPLEVAVGAVWVALLSGQNFLAEILRGSQRFASVAAFGGVLSNFILLMVAVGLWQLDITLSLLHLLAISCLATSGSLTIAAIQFRYACKRLVAGRSALTTATTASTARASLPAAASDALLLTMTQIDVWLVAAIGTSEDVALYATATRFAFLIQLPGNILNSAVAPMIGQHVARNDTAALQPILQAFAAIATLPGLLVLATFLFGGEHILATLLGASYGESHYIILLLGLAHLISVALGPTSGCLLMHNQQAALMKSNFATFLITLPVIVLLSVLGQANGTALGVLLATATRACAIYSLNRRTTGMSVHADPHPLFAAIKWIRSRYF